MSQELTPSLSPGALLSSIQLELGTVAGIPVLTCIPGTETPCPVVFYIPGFTGERASGLSLAYQFAARGIACISFDPLYHGSRHDACLLQAADPIYGGVYPPESGIDMFLTFLRVIEQSVNDIQTLLGVLNGDSRLDLNRAGVTGFSMGAYATFLAFASVPQLRAAVAMMGVPTFTQRWIDLLDECVWSNPAWAEALSPIEDVTREKTAYVRSIDPAIRLRKAAPKPLLLMSGDFDCDQMKTYVLSWYRQSRDAWKTHPEYLKWNVYPVGHTVTTSMEQDAVDWFATHLCTSKST